MEDYDIKQVSLRIKTDVYEKIKEIADKEHRSINGQIELIIDKYLDMKNT